VGDLRVLQRGMRGDAGINDGDGDALTPAAAIRRRADGIEALAAEGLAPAGIRRVGLRRGDGQAGNASDEIRADVGVVGRVRVEIALQRGGIAKAHACGAEFDIIAEHFEPERRGTIPKRGERLGRAEGEQGLVGQSAGNVQRGDGGKGGRCAGWGGGGDNGWRRLRHDGRRRWCVGCLCWISHEGTRRIGRAAVRFDDEPQHRADHQSDGGGEQEDRQTVGAHERGENFAQGCAGASSALPRRGTLLNSSLVASRRFA
jgi:hypothetical protein